jgi:hypothetical protein
MEILDESSSSYSSDHVSLGVFPIHGIEINLTTRDLYHTHHLTVTDYENHIYDHTMEPQPTCHANVWIKHHTLIISIIGQLLLIIAVIVDHFSLHLIGNDNFATTLFIAGFPMVSYVLALCWYLVLKACLKLISE